MSKKSKFYRRADGKYLGEFEGRKPKNAVEIPEPPEHAADVWTGTGWDTSARPAPEVNPLEAAIREIAKGYGVARRKAILSKLEGK